MRPPGKTHMPPAKSSAVLRRINSVSSPPSASRATITVAAGIGGTGAREGPERVGGLDGPDDVVSRTGRGYDLTHKRSACAHPTCYGTLSPTCYGSLSTAVRRDARASAQERGGRGKVNWPKGVGPEGLASRLPPSNRHCRAPGRRAAGPSAG